MFDALHTSPLTRHPSLLLRKARERLGFLPAFRLEAAPAHVVYRPLHALRPVLQTWRDRVPTGEEPWPPTRLFHQDFDEALLWDLVRSGPRAARDLTGDLKLIWEFGRSHGVFLAALQGDVAASFTGKWIGHTTDPAGPAWRCPMDVALRAVNWLAADALLEGRLAAATDESDWTSDLWNAGRLLEQRLEARWISSNHYLSNLLGLFLLGQALGQERWTRFARDEFPRALRAQTWPDGGLYEASLPYHALVTEMALLFRAAGGDAGPVLPAMCQVLADTMDADGDVFPVGDNDSGRILPIDFLAQRHGRAQALLELAQILGLPACTPRADALYPDSGWRILRAGDWTALLEFGSVGMFGGGAHAHNDDLSLCLNWKGRRIFADRGSGLYTSDPELRNALRSVRAHTTFSAGDREPRPIPAARPTDVFSLPGAARAPDPARLARRIESDGTVFRIVDTPPASHEETVWRFQLDPAWTAEPGSGLVSLRSEAGVLTLTWSDPSLAASVEPAQHALRYGTVVPATQFVVRRPAAARGPVTWELRPRA